MRSLWDLTFYTDTGADPWNLPLYTVAGFPDRLPVCQCILLILYYATGGRAIGGGDVKLMAVCGLLLGWKLIIFAFLLGCIIGSVIHLIRMKVSGEGHVLAMGPYLSAGVAVAVLWGNEFLQWYLGLYH